MKRRCIRFISLVLAFVLLMGDWAVAANAASTVSLASPSLYFGAEPKMEMDHAAVTVMCTAAPPVRKNEYGALFACKPQELSDWIFVSVNGFE